MKECKVIKKGIPAKNYYSIDRDLYFNCLKGIL